MGLLFAVARVFPSIQDVLSGAGKNTNALEPCQSALAIEDVGRMNADIFGIHVNGFAIDEVLFRTLFS
jgi:hypothetical protein